MKGGSDDEANEFHGIRDVSKLDDGSWVLSSTIIPPLVKDFVSVVDKSQGKID